MLVVAPHPDDAELGMGGAILRYKAEGFRVGVLDLTSGEPTPFGSPRSAPRKRPPPPRSCGSIGGGIWGFPTAACSPRSKHGHCWLASFASCGRGCLFSPYWVDAHPDHLAAVELIEAARFWSKLTKTDMPGQPHHPARILYYNCVHLRLVEKPAFVLDISDIWEKKRASIECYRSQFITGRPQEPPTFIDRLRDQAAYWGWSIGTAYGEPFASREPIGLASMRDLL